MRLSLLLLFFLPFTTYAQRYFVTELDRAGAGGVWTCVMSEIELDDQIYLRDTSFPESEIYASRSKGFFISQISYTGTEFLVVMDKASRLDNNGQSIIKATTEAWADSLKNVRNRRQSVREMFFARGIWYIIVDNVEIDQVRNQSAYLNEGDYISKRDQKGYYITNARFGDNHWGFVFSKKPADFVNQFIAIDQVFPSGKVKQYLERGYRITDVSYGKGLSSESGPVWFIVMTKLSGSGRGYQSLIASSEFPSKEIAEIRSISQENRPAEQPGGNQTSMVVSPSVTKVYGVFVGVEMYGEFRRLSGGGRFPTDLDYIANDAKLIHDYYSRIADKSMIGEFLLLVDRDASKKNIIARCKEIYSKADSDDIVIFYFSGHGSVGYFCSYDYNLYHSELSDIFNECKAKIQICIADACHSGSWDMAPPISKSTWGSAIDEYQRTMNTNIKGRCLLMAAQSDQYSLVGEEFKCSVFTYYLKKGLTGAADFNKNKIITVGELYSYLEKEVYKYSCEVKNSCFRPQLNGNPDPVLPIGVVN